MCYISVDCKSKAGRGGWEAASSHSDGRLQTCTSVRSEPVNFRLLDQYVTSFGGAVPLERLVRVDTCSYQKIIRYIEDILVGQVPKLYCTDRPETSPPLQA